MTKIKNERRKKMDRRIKVWWSSNGWLADFVGDEEIQELFGTTLIPTAFTAQSRKEIVIQSLKELNPGYQVD
jgi:hypothetical protein